VAGDDAAHRGELETGLVRALRFDEDPVRLAGDPRAHVAQGALAQTLLAKDPARERNLLLELVDLLLRGHKPPPALFCMGIRPCRQPLVAGQLRGATTESYKILD